MHINVEFKARCSEPQGIKKILQNKEAHPYEEVAFDIYSLLDENEL